MTYQKQKERIIEWIEKGLIPNLIERSYPYDKTISAIAFEIGCTEKAVEEVIKSYIILGKLKQENLLVATDEQVIKHFKKTQEFKKEADNLIGTWDISNIKELKDKNGSITGYKSEVGLMNPQTGEFKSSGIEAFSGVKTTTDNKGNRTSSPEGSWKTKEYSDEEKKYNKN